MLTPWGELAVRDAHVHFFSHGFFAGLAAQHGSLRAEEIPARLEWEAPPREASEFGARWVAELDRHGVASAAIIASLPGDAGSVAEAVERFPDRFHGYFFVNPLAEGAADSVAASLLRGLRGICLFPAMFGFSLHDERVRPVLDLAAATEGAAVFVHCGMLTVGVRKRLGLPSLFDLRYSNPVDVHALALRYQRLPFVLPHFGAGYFREALMVAGLCPNVYLDTSSSNDWMKTQPERLTLREVFERALDVAGPSRLLFGTDSSFFPRGWHRAVFDRQVETLREIGVDAEAAAAIFGGNLQRLVPLPIK